MTFFDLVLQTLGSLHPDGGPDRFISEYAGLILAEGEDGKVRRVGKVHAQRIHADLAARHREPLFDVCACHSHALHEVHALLYEPGQYHFKEALIDRFEAADCDCLVVDYVVLHPRWRGLRLGLLAVRKLLDLLGGGCGLAVSEVLPLDPEAHDLLNVPPSWLPRQDTREAVLKLRRYFRRLGFERVGRTRYYALPLAGEMPTLADLLRPTPRAGEQKG